MHIYGKCFENKLKKNPNKKKIAKEKKSLTKEKIGAYNIKFQLL